MSRGISWTAIGLPLVAGLVGGALSSWLFGAAPVFAQKLQTPSVPKVIRAERVELLDKRGVVRAVLEVLADGSPQLRLGPELAASDATQQVIAMTNDQIFVKQPLGSIHLGSWPWGSSGLAIMYPNCCMVDIGPKTLTFKDGAGEDRLKLAMDPAKEFAGIALYDRGAKARALLTATGGDALLGVIRGDGTGWTSP
jgi:hypothetical protein